jgi:hypothetical protein
MRKMMQWVMAATLVCGASVFTACSVNDNPATPSVEPQDGLVTLPLGVVPEDYSMLKGEYVQTPDGPELNVIRDNVKVAFDGTDVYVSGLSYWYEDGYIKGTIDGGTAVFPSGQLIAKDGEDLFYLNGVTRLTKEEKEEGKSETITDIRFSYDATTRTLQLSDKNLIVESNAPGCMDHYAFVCFAKLTRGTWQEPSIVTPPAGIETQQWYVRASNENGAVNGTVGVVQNGQDIYLQGLFPQMPSAWIKGTINGNKAVFPTSQYLGMSDDKEMYIQGQLENDDESDIELYYDAENSRFIAKQYAVLTEGFLEATNDYYSELVISREPNNPTAVEPPVGLQTEEYDMSAYDYDMENNTIDYEGKVSNFLKIGFDGQDVYIKRIYDSFSNAWVKGTLSADGKTITIPANQYLGTLRSAKYIDEYYVTAIDSRGAMTDLVFNYDAAQGVLTTNQIIYYNTRPDIFVPYPNPIVQAVISKKTEVAATPVAPSIDMSKTWHDYQLTLDIPLVGTNDAWLMSDKTFYMVWIEKNGQAQPYTFKTASYDDLTADMTEIPYTFQSDTTFVECGRNIFIHETAAEVDSWTQVGVQTIYRGGGEEHKSGISWITPNFEIPDLE